MDKLKSVAKRYYLDVSPTLDKYLRPIPGVFEVASVRVLGLTEFDTVKEFCIGVFELIKYEDAM